MFRLRFIPFGHSPFTALHSAQHDDCVVCGLWYVGFGTWRLVHVAVFCHWNMIASKRMGTQHDGDVVCEIHQSSTTRSSC